MRKLTIIPATLVMLLTFSCQPTDDEKATPLLSTIERLFHDGHYRQALDSITSLRERYPKAVKARRQSLRLWQEASLALAQKDVGTTDSLLQETLAAIPLEADRYKANMLRVRRDSLQARYEALCGVVRMIHMRQREDATPQ